MVVHAVGLTPAWQQILVFRNLSLGNVNRALSANWCASGKVLNVGSALSHLGCQTQTIALVGGVTGQSIVDDFARLSIQTRWIHSQAPTRVCTTLIDQSTATTTELVENAAPIRVDELQTYRKVYHQEVESEDWTVFAGSLPLGVDSGWLHDLLAETDGSRLILDIRAADLWACLPLKPRVVKPNREELAATVGRTISSEAEVFVAMQELVDAGARTVVISQGADPVLLLDEAGGRYRVYPPSIEPVNPIGCGDSLAAGIAAGLSRGSSVIDAVKLGVAAAAENAVALLPCRMARYHVEQRIPLIRVEQL